MLALSANLLCELPAGLSALPHLEELRLDDNRLAALDLAHDGNAGAAAGEAADGRPGAVAGGAAGGAFAALRVLGLSVNPLLSALPASLCGLSALRQLSIGAAKLQALPDGLQALVGL
eukprot:6945101-Prymnesium_polylepis.1